MADTQELDESMIVSESEDQNGGGDGAMMETETAPEAGAAPKKPRTKRASVKSVEGRVVAIEQRVEAFGQELAQLTRMTEQLAHLSGKIARLEESLEARSSNGGSSHDGGNRRPGAPVGRAVAEARLRARAAELEPRLKAPHFVGNEEGRFTKGPT